MSQSVDVTVRADLEALGEMAAGANFEPRVGAPG